MTLGIQKVLHLHLEEAKKKPKISGEYMYSTKLDGWFCYIDYLGNGVWDYVRSRQHREIPSMYHAMLYVKQLPKPNGSYRFLMEAVIPGKSFYEANGIMNRSVGDCQAEEVIFHIHDMINLDTYKENWLSNEAWHRYKDLKEWFGDTESEKFKIHPLLGVSANRDDWMEAFYNAERNGEEGIVLKHCHSLYQPDKRNSSLMKIKLEDTYDLLCISAYSSEGKKGNMAYNLLLRDKAGTKVPVVIGSHSLIHFFEDEPPIGKVVQIKCMCRTSDGIYREPRYDCIRFDKTEKDID